MGGSPTASRTCSSLAPLLSPRGHPSWDPQPRPTMGLTATALGQRVFPWARHRGWLLPKWGPRLELTWGHRSRSTCSRKCSRRRICTSSSNTSHRHHCTSSRRRTPCITSLRRLSSSSPSSSSRPQRTSSTRCSSSSSQGPRKACLPGSRASLGPGTLVLRTGRRPASRGCPCSPRRRLARHP